ncbi:MAG: YihY/virulence factor BrkB family protein [Rhodospirillaceae bacterium]|nr:YihY/virulence factor BrkB family protein [Rhodospirillaceae bacterium]
MKLVDVVVRRAMRIRAVRVGSKAVMRFLQHDGPVLSGHMAFTALLAAFPFVVFLAALSGLIGDAETADHLVTSLFQFVPVDVAETLGPPLASVIEERRGGLATFGALGALWAASNGLEALRTALNRAYQVEKEPAIWWQRLQSIGLVIAFATGISVVSSLVVLGPLGWEFIERLAAVDSEDELAFSVARYAIATLFLFLMVMALHRLLPNVTLRWARVFPGVVFTVIAWLVVSTLASLYFGSIADYQATYGALGGIIVTLLFFYVSAAIFVFGAEINGWGLEAARRRAHVKPPVEE